MVIRIRDIVPGANTSEEGELVFKTLNGALSAHQPDVVVSFEGIQTATSSFVNAAFVELLNGFSYEELRRRIRVTNSTRQINDMIKMRLARSSHMVA